MRQAAPLRTLRSLQQPGQLVERSVDRHSSRRLGHPRPSPQPHGRASALALAATADLSRSSWSTDGLTPLAADRLARHLRDRAWEENGAPAIGAVRLLGALDDELAADFVTELAAHHRDPEVAAAAHGTATTRRWR